MNHWADKRVLITGGSGFIGSHLAKKLIEQGAEVALTSPNDHKPWRLSDHADAVPNFPLRLPNEKAVRNIFEEYKPHVVFHLAALLKLSREMPEDFSKINFEGTQSVFNEAVRTDVEHFVTLGSAQEYGHISSPYHESNSPHPKTSYGASKLQVTEWLQGTVPKRMRTVVIRPATVYGPKQLFNMGIPNWIHSCLTNSPISVPLENPGVDFVYVEDLVEALLKTPELKKGELEIVNIGYGEAINIHTVVDTVTTALDCNPSKTPFDAGVPYTWWLDISKAKEVLTWEPRTSFKEGIQKTVTWYKENQDLFPKLMVR